MKTLFCLTKMFQIFEAACTFLKNKLIKITPILLFNKRVIVKNIFYLFYIFSDPLLLFVNSYRIKWNAWLNFYLLIFSLVTNYRFNLIAFVLRSESSTQQQQQQHVEPCQGWGRILRWVRVRASVPGAGRHDIGRSSRNRRSGKIWWPLVTSDVFSSVMLTLTTSL